SGGMPLDFSIQRELGERMDADFSDVRIHTGGKAAQAAESIDAKAFTCGNAIVFNSGEYDPRSADGQHLLAHELAHVTQQDGSAPLSMMPQEDADLEIDPDPKLERAADEAATEALSGEEPLVVNRMGTDVHVQRTALGKLNPFSNSDGEKAGDLVADEVKAEPEALAEEVRRIKVNQAKLSNQVNSERGTVDTVGEAAGAGVVGGTVGLAVGAATANPVLGALAGGAASDVGKTLYGKLWGKGRDAIAEAEIPDIGTERLDGIKETIDDLIDEKLRKRFSGNEHGGEDYRF
ncbi:eCIS core domain-containing protein, partial [Natrinema sp. JCM 9743]